MTSIHEPQPLAQWGGSFAVESVATTAPGVTGVIEWRATPVGESVLHIACEKLKLSIPTPPILQLRVDLGSEKPTTELINSVCGLVFTRDFPRISIVYDYKPQVRPLLSYGVKIFQAPKIMQGMLLDELMWSDFGDGKTLTDFGLRFDRILDILATLPPHGGNNRAIKVLDQLLTEKASPQELGNLELFLRHGTFDAFVNLNTHARKRILSNKQLAQHYGAHKAAVKKLATLSSSGDPYEAIVVHRHLHSLDRKLFGRLSAAYARELTKDIVPLLTAPCFSQGMLEERPLHDILTAHYGPNVYSDFCGKWGELHREDRLSSSPRGDEFFNVSRFLNLLRLYSEGWDEALPFDMALLLIDED